MPTVLVGMYAPFVGSQTCQKNGTSALPALPFSLERAIAQTNRVVKVLVRAGVSLRSDVRELHRYRAASEKFHAQTEQNLAEITGKLDAMIDIVDKSIRRNGRHGHR